MKRGKERVHFPETVALLVGTIIGAGVLGIPYVLAQSGFLFGLLNIAILGFIILMINLYVGEIALRTKKDHMLPGYAEKYLGKWGKIAITFSTFFTLFGAMIAYVIGEGEVLAAFFGGNPIMWGWIFFIVFSGVIFFRLNIIAKSGLLLTTIVVGLIILISLLAAPSMDFANLGGGDIKNVFLPYGVILFAFAGISAIPEMEAELGKNKKKLKKAIILGSLIPISLYALFAFVVLGVTGTATTEVATIGLGELLGGNMVLFGNLFAFFAMATSFILVGYALKWMFYYDYNLSRGVSWILTWIIPLIFLLIFNGSFIGVIGLTGAVAGGIEGILVVLMVLQAKKKGEVKPAYSIPMNWLIAAIFLLIFIFGIVYQFLF
ncbi:aromatic amino acid transport family protein [Nanoarchaeota archaeon]